MTLYGHAAANAFRVRAAAGRLAQAAAAALGALDAADQHVTATLARAEAQARHGEVDRADPIADAIASLVDEFAPGPAGAQWTEAVEPVLDPLAVASYVRMGSVSRRDLVGLPL